MPILPKRFTGAGWGIEVRFTNAAHMRSEWRWFHSAATRAIYVWDTRDEAEAAMRRMYPDLFALERVRVTEIAEASSLLTFSG